MQPITNISANSIGPALRRRSVIHVETLWCTFQVDIDTTYANGQSRGAGNKNPRIYVSAPINDTSQAHRALNVYPRCVATCARIRVNVGLPINAYFFIFIHACCFILYTVL